LSGLELNSAGQWPSRTGVAHPNWTLTVSIQLFSTAPPSELRFTESLQHQSGTRETASKRL